MKKTICFDLRPLQIGHQNRGIGMMIKSMLDNLTDDKNDYIFYVFDKNNPLENLNISPKLNYIVITSPTLSAEVKKPADIIASLRLFFHKYSALKPYKPDYFVQFDFTLGMPKWKKTKTILIAYDLIPLIMKNDYLPSPYFAWSHTIGKKAKIKAVIKSAYYFLRYKLQYRNYIKCDKIVSISKSTTQSFIKKLDVKPKKIITIPLAPVSLTNSLDDEIIKKIKKPYLFYIGGTDSRKHVDHIIFAFNIIRSRGYDMHLVLAGSEFRDPKTIPDNATRDAVNASPYKKDILCLGFINDAEKNSLYKNAHAFVFTSYYEGFGLPVIEAESNSCPVIAYNNSSIPEAAGNAAILVESGNYIEIANQVINLFSNNVRNSRIENGVRHANKYSWKYYISSFISLIGK